MNDREKFEKHAKEVLKLCVDIGVDGEYESDRTRENWLTGQAATAAASTWKREWVGLTDNEIKNLYYSLEKITDYKDAVLIIEAKLKEKNT